MNAFSLIALIITLTALLAYINIRFLKLPSTIGVMVLSLLLSFLLLLVGFVSPAELLAKDLMKQIDFSESLLDFMLGFLLFAGALHTDVQRLSNAKWPIFIYATAGILISTILVAGAVYFLLPIFFRPVDFIYCLLFGALISPTDPIAVISILKKAGISESIEIKITGESLFNDGVGVVVFLTLFNIASKGLDDVTTSEIILLLVEEIVGGIALGLLLGYVGFFMLKKINHYQTEVLITLSIVMTGVVIAPIFHFSVPLAMVVAGLFIGNKGAREAMSKETKDYVHKFWEMIDEILNAILFVLIGLELLIIPVQISFLYIGLASIFVVIFCRYVSLIIPSYLFRLRLEFPQKTFLIMTWGGLRGGISIALALSLNVGMERDLIVSMTYIVVLFSIIVQGLTLEKFVRKLG